MHKIKQLTVAIVLIAGSCVAVSALPSAAGASAPPGCSASFSADGHSVSAKCSGITHHGSSYRITVQACNTTNCSWTSSNTVAYGGTVSVSSGGYIQSTSLYYSWLISGTSYCTFTHLSGSVQWCDMQASIQDWSARGIVYNGSWQLNWYKDRNYRPDCSGLVDMAWHLNADPNTDSLPNYSKAVSKSYGTSTAYMQMGDVLDDTIDGHAVIFAGWNSDHVHFSVWSFGFGTMGPGKLFTNEPKQGTSDTGQTGLIVAGKLWSNYHPYRYNNKSGL